MVCPPSCLCASLLSSPLLIPVCLTGCLSACLRACLPLSLRARPAAPALFLSWSFCVYVNLCLPASLPAFYASSKVQQRPPCLCEFTQQLSIIRSFFSFPHSVTFLQEPRDLTLFVHGCLPSSFRFPFVRPTSSISVHALLLLPFRLLAVSFFFSFAVVFVFCFSCIFSFGTYGSVWLHMVML